MNDSFWFESLAEIWPGKSTLNDVTGRWGTPQISGLWYTYQEQGIRVIVYDYSAGYAQPTVEEVAIIPPYNRAIPCGIRLGSRKPDALRVIRDSYDVTDEYEDAIYFHPSDNTQLLASVEFMDHETVVLIELMHDSEK